MTHQEQQHHERMPSAAPVLRQNQAGGLGRGRSTVTALSAEMMVTQRAIKSAASSSARSSRRNQVLSSSSKTACLFALVLMLFTNMLVVVEATKHSFHMKDGPSLIGPVGVPFGFMDTGYYELKVRFLFCLL